MGRDLSKPIAYEAHIVARLREEGWSGDVATLRTLANRGGVLAATPVETILAELQRRRDAWASMSHTVDGQDDLDEDEGEQLANEYDDVIKFVRGLIPPSASEPTSPPVEAPCYTPPAELPERFFRVRFYKQETSVERFSIIVRENGPEEARQRVKAWGVGEIELTEDEAESENYERQEDTLDSEFSALEEAGGRYAVIELDADDNEIAVTESATV